MDRMSIGPFIAALRKARGLTQKELAAMLSVSDKTVSRWETGDGTPELALIPVLAEIFGVTCDELLRGERRPQDRDAGPSAPQGEKRREWLLKSAMTKLNIKAVISLGLTLFGLVVLYMCLVESVSFMRRWGYVLWLLAVSLFITAAIVQVAALLSAYSQVRRTEDTAAFRLSAYRRSTVSLLASCAGLGAALGGWLGSLVYGYSSIMECALLGAAAALVLCACLALTMYKAFVENCAPSRD